MTATRVWQFYHDPPVFSTAMGSVQRMPNGNTVIGWGATFNAPIMPTPGMTEVTPDGKTIFEFLLGQGIFSYRAIKDVPASAYASVNSAGNSAGAGVEGIQFTAEQSGDEIHISLSSPQMLNAKIVLYDATGRDVRDLYSGSTQSQTITLAATGLPAGPYFCRLTGAGVSIARPIAIVN
jgi:hypothetical protein